jgi:hypothetical protein
LLAAGAMAAFGQAQPAWAGYGACLAEAKTSAQTDACDGRYLRAPAAGAPGDAAAALRNIDANRAALKSRIAAVEAELAQLGACAKGGSGIR